MFTELLFIDILCQHVDVVNNYDPATPYNSLPHLPPAVELETKAVLKAAIEARTRVAELEMACHRIPNPAVLIRSIALQEAKSSSEIENIFTTNDELYQAASKQQATAIDPYTKEVLRYQEALWDGFHRVSAGDPFDLGLILGIGKHLIPAGTSIRQSGGTHIRNAATKEVVYTPPTGAERIEGLLQDLCEFLNSDTDHDPLVRMAVGHYQFEAIHPFHDGNGRTGRVLNVLLLVRQRLLSYPVLYLSRFLINNRPEYYAGLRRVTENQDWEAWILLLLRGVAETSIQTSHKIQSIIHEIQDATEKTRTLAPKIYSRELVETIFLQPYTRIGHLVEREVAQRQTASVYLQKLEEIGILQSQKVGRDTLYLNPALLDILRA